MGTHDMIIAPPTQAESRRGRCMGESGSRHSPKSEETKRERERDRETKRDRETDVEKEEQRPGGIRRE